MLLANRQFSDGKRGRRAGLAMHQENLWKGASALKLWMKRCRSYANTPVVRQYILLSSWAVGITPLWGDWKSLVIRTCGQHGYTATCPHAWSRKKWKSYRIRLIVKTAAHLSIKYKLTNMPQLRGKLVYWKPMTPCSDQESVKTFRCMVLEFLWGSSRWIAKDEPSGNSLG